MNRFTICILLGLILAAGLTSADVVRWIPGAASNPGEAGTEWSSDLWIFNRVFDAPIEVHIAFISDPLPTGTEPDEVTIEVPAGATTQITDVVGSLFGENRPGALRLRSDHLFEAQSRTFNSGNGNGAYGQAVPAVFDGDGDDFRLLVGALNRPGDDGVRCNLGLYNITKYEGDVQITVTDQDTGEIVGEPDTNVTVGGFGWYQANVFDLVGADDAVVENATVFISGYTGIRGYLSRIDNRTGDGSFFLPLKASMVHFTPADWEVTLTLSYSDASIDWIVYTGSNGFDVTVPAPVDGWTTTVVIRSPGEFCYTVIGTNNGGASIQMEHSLARDGEDCGGGARAVYFSGEGTPVRLEDCFDLG